MEASAEIIDLLRRNSLFQEFTEEDIQKILPLIREVNIEKGSFIINQGEVGNEVYVIRRGTVEVLKKSGLRKRFIQITTFQEGDSFGELALIDSGYRSASIRAMMPVSLLIFSINEIRSAIHDSEIVLKLYKGLAQQLSSRLRFTNEAMVSALSREEERAQSRLYLRLLLLGSMIILCLFSFTIGRVTSGGTTRTSPPQIIIQ